jgi:hypothetical protein
LLLGLAFLNTIQTVNESTLIPLGAEQTAVVNIDVLNLPEVKIVNQYFEAVQLISADRDGSRKLLWREDTLWLDSLLEIVIREYYFDGYKSSFISVTSDLPAIFDIDLTDFRH